MSANSENRHSWAVVLAGGDGSRLQQLTQKISGDSRPKQFCPLFGEKSLLSHTRERIAPLFPQDRTLFVLSSAHREYYGVQLAGVSDALRVVQPANRGTGVAMALCVQTILRLDEDATVAFIPSDHYYANPQSFCDCVESALEQVEQYPSSVVVVGADARYPETEYGWIQPGRTLVDSLVHPLQRVSRFWEKPTARRAEILLRRGCLWNTFVTIGFAGAFLELFQATVPQLTKALESVNNASQMEELYSRIASVDFSKTVLRGATRRLMVLRDGGSGWTDLGTPHRVLDTLSRHGLQPSWLDRTWAFQTSGKP